MIYTKDEWDDWKQHPVTKEFFRMLAKERESVKENLVLGIYEEDERARGIAKCLLDVIEMTYDDFREIAYDKQQRNSSKGTSDINPS